MSRISTETGAARSMRILLIDDEPMVCEVVREMLEVEGHAVEVAPTGEQGLEAYAERGPFHLVITDMSLPGMDGSEVALEIKRQNPAQPILLMTGFVSESIEAMLRAPNTISLVVSKPVKHSELIKALDYIVAHTPTEGRSQKDEG